MVTLAKQSTNLPRPYNLDAEGLRSTWDKVYCGFVRKKYQDALHMGRLQVWIPELCGPDREESWIILDYASPFAGATSVRNLSQNPGSGQTSHGMWFVTQEEDNAVLCMFVNGDPNRGFWFANLFHMERHRMTPSHPGNSRPGLESNPLQSGRARTLEASNIARRDNFVATNISATTASGFELSNDTIAQTENTTRTAMGSTEPAPVETATPPAGAVAQATEQAGTANIPVVGPSSYGTHNSYDVYGISTPGSNRIVMSDQAGDTQIRIQTRNNQQILLHNQSDIIVIMTGSGKSRIELDGAGNIDVYGAGAFSVRSEGDLNLHSDQNVNINAGSIVNMRSGGDLKLTSVGRMHMFSHGNLHQTSLGETHRLSVGSMFDSSTNKMHRESNFGIFDAVDGGDGYNLYSNGVIKLTTRQNFELLAVEEVRLQSRDGNFHVQSGQKLFMLSKSDSHIKTEGVQHLESAQAFNLLSKAALNLDAQAEVNLRAQSGSLNLQSQDANVNIAGGPLVVIGPATSINAGSVPSAGGADAADNALTASVAAQPGLIVPASEVVVTEHVVQDTRNRLGGGSQGRVVTSVGSRVPSAEPAPNRFLASPGYSGTNTIELDANVNLKVGQIEQGQPVPLQCMGFLDAGSKITVGSANPGTFASALVPGGGSQSRGVYLDIPPEGRGLLDAIAKPESGGRYNVITGGQTFTDYIQHPGVFVGDSSAAGRYQITSTTWNEYRGKYNLTDFSPVSQDRAAWYIAQERYARNSGGRNLLSDLQAGNLNLVQQYLGSTWTALRTISASEFQTSYAQGLAAGQASQAPAASNPPASPDNPSQAAVTDAQPQRYVGMNYDGDTPVYVRDPTPNWTFKKASEWSLSETGLQDIINFETLSGPKPDDLSGKSFENQCGGKRMIGHGHVISESEQQSGEIQVGGTKVKIADGITAEQAKTLLEKDLEPIQAKIKSVITNVITSTQFDALVDFAWNLGLDTFEKTQVVKLITDKKYDHVPTEMMKHVYACGFSRQELVSRRRANALRFAGILRAETPVTVDARYTGNPIGTPNQPAFAQNPQAYPNLNFTSGPAGVINNPNNPEGFQRTDPRILEIANRMGQQLGVTLTVNSAYRSPSYDAGVGGVGGYHTKGSQPPGTFPPNVPGVAQALDIQFGNVPGGVVALKEAARRNGIRWTRTYARWLHIDLGPARGGGDA